MSKNPRVDELRIDPQIKEFFGDVIYKYTSEEATQDGILFDLDLLVKAGKMQFVAQLPIKYITTNLLDLDYWKDRCTP
jgi:hypothetical protein